MRQLEFFFFLLFVYFFSSRHVLVVYYKALTNLQLLVFVWCLMFPYYKFLICMYSMF